MKKFSLTGLHFDVTISLTFIGVPFLSGLHRIKANEYGMIEAHFLSVYSSRGMGPVEVDGKEKMPKEELPVKVFPGCAVNNCVTVINVI
ncbi:MAG: hypothetical protein GX115_01485 [Ruminiclostridium sp.]|nr:hypothetical protein [Ruminiclostridium sp.]